MILTPHASPQLLFLGLFERFNQHCDAKGYIARGGQIVDATIVNAPKQHLTPRREHGDQESGMGGTNTLIGNADGNYDPALFNGRLLLGRTGC